MPQQIPDNAWMQAAVDGPAGLTYQEHTSTLRGVVRQRLVTRAIAEYLPAPPARVLDVGGGNGVQALALAQLGYQVTVCEPDLDMLEHAAKAIDDEPDLVRHRIQLVHGDGYDVPELVGDGWDVTLCHGVLMFVPDPDRLLRILVQVTRPGGVISVVTKNNRSIAMRAGLQGRWSDALALVDAQRAAAEVAAAGPSGCGDDADEVRAALTEAGADPLAWYGVRILTDHLGDVPPGPDLEDVVAAEWAAGTLDPYRRVARLFHLIHRRTS